MAQSLVSGRKGGARGTKHMLREEGARGNGAVEGALRHRWVVSRFDGMVQSSPSRLENKSTWKYLGLAPL